jgi:hypothetical protein
MKPSTVDQRDEAVLAVLRVRLGRLSVGEVPALLKSFESDGCTRSHQLGLPAMLVLTMIQVPWSPTALQTPPT